MGNIDSENLIHSWQVGVAALALFVIFSIDATIHTQITCDKSARSCAVTQLGFYSKESSIYDLNKGFRASISSSGRGFYALTIENTVSKRDVTDYFGFKSSAQTYASKINAFIASKHQTFDIEITDYKSIFFNLCLLLFGVFSVWRSLKPYVLNELTKQSRRTK